MIEQQQNPRRKIYISGPMAGYPDMNTGRFNQAARDLHDAGFEPVNPVDNGLPSGLTPSDYMRVDLVMLLGCSGVATIGEWRESWGACIEVNLAHELGIPVLPLGVWVGVQDQ